MKHFFAALLFLIFSIHLSDSGSSRHKSSETADSLLEGGLFKSKPFVINETRAPTYSYANSPDRLNTEAVTDSSDILSFTDLKPEPINPVHAHPIYLRPIDYFEILLI